jgi:DNA repair exonuclease SbcCD ATPase subunit
LIRPRGLWYLLPRHYGNAGGTRTMALVGAQRASELTGVSRSTIQRHMKIGRVSYQVSPGGGKQIDVSELERVYGLKKAEQAEQAQGAAVTQAEMEAERLRLRVEMLETRLDIAQEQIEDLKAQRDKWQQQASQVMLSSQHAQREAQEYKEMLRARQRKEAAAKRAAAEKRALESKVARLKAQNENTSAPDADAGGIAGAFRGMWSKVRRAAG